MRSQNGNVLFLILIAVALFAALSYAVTSSNRSGGGNVSKEKAQAYAAQLIQYGASMRSAIMRMKLSNGCTDDMLDFSTPAYIRFDGTETTPENPDAPVDHRCDLFHPNGGGLSPIIASAEALFTPPAPPTMSVLPGHGAPSVAQFFGIGTSGTAGTASANDIAFSIIWLDRGVCMAINDLVGVPNDGAEPPMQIFSGSSSYSFPNPYEKNGTMSIGVDGAAVFCRKGGTDKYIFTQVLIER